MELLAGVGDVYDALGVVFLDARLDAGEVTRRVVVAAVGLADDSDAELLGFEVDDESTLRLDGEPHLLELCDDAGHGVVVVRLAAIRVELHAELRVHAVELADGNVDEALPEREVVLVALLELHELLLARVLPHAVLLLRLRRGEDIALLEVGDGEVLALLVGEKLAVALDEYAELRAPVAEVVVGYHVVAERAEDAVYRAANDGRADVADVHLLRRIGRGVVDDDLLARALLRDAAAGPRAEVRELRIEPGGGDGEVEEPWAGDLDLLEDVVALERLGHFRADLARVGLRLLRELERVVALVVAEFRIGSGQHPDAAEVLAGIRLLKGRLHNIAEFHKS